MSNYDALFEPLQLKSLKIRNRFLSTSHAPGLAFGGVISDRYIRYQAEKAKGGVGLTQFGGATAVSPENSCYYGQINGAVEAVVPQYRRMAAAIHEHGACCAVQLTHGGRRERWDIANWLPTYSASTLREIVHGSFPVVMEDYDIRRVVRDFATAASRARDGDVDGVEISCQAATLIEQFWSPVLNQRTDRYGGCFENRMRLGLEIFAAVREAVGEDYVVGIRMPGAEMLKGGLSPEDCVQVATSYAGSGLIDFISVVGGNALDYQGEAKYGRRCGSHRRRICRSRKAIRDEVVRQGQNIPCDPDDGRRHRDARAEVGLGRHGRDDARLSGRPPSCQQAESRERGRDSPLRRRRLLRRSGHQRVGRVLRPQCRDDSRGEHSANRHAHRRPDQKVVIVGGGPAGMEAARISAGRGHRVVLFEAARELGGQLLLAAKATWRRDMAGITAWLVGQMGLLGVDVRFNAYAEAADILSERPDVVVVATGGHPNVGKFDGAELAAATWDVLAGHVACERDILLIDENGSAPGLSCAEFAAARGSNLYASPRPIARSGASWEGPISGVRTTTELYKLGVTIEVDIRLVSIVKSGNKLLATLANTYTGRQTELRVDQVIGENGTLPNDEVDFALKEKSKNCGEVDLRRLIELEPQIAVNNPDGAFQLFRIGDAWTSRNLHAAMLDAARIAHPL